MKVEEAVHWIHAQRYTGHKNGLENTFALLKALGNPQDAFPAIHIAGTNGKGSTAAMVESCLRACGYKTGMYTSPYLEQYAERIRASGEMIPDSALIEGVERIQSACEGLDSQPTTFEIGTALAFWYFREAGVQAAVIECGLGGRFDCTNVLTPVASLICAIGLDHMKYLGNTLPEIAREKAGIIKPRVPAVVMRQDEEILRVFERAAQEKGAPLWIAERPQPLEITPRQSRFDLPPFGELEIRLPGRHQLLNASLALNGLRASGLNVHPEGIQEGMLRAEWPGRLEWIGDFLLDGAHNPQGASTLRAYLDEHFPRQPLTLLTAILQDKQPAACADKLAGAFSQVIATTVSEPRAMAPEALAALYRERGVPSLAAPTPEEALRLSQGRVVVAGSLYLVGAVRALLKGGE